MIIYVIVYVPYIVLNDYYTYILKLRYQMINKNLQILHILIGNVSIKLLLLFVYLLFAHDHIHLFAVLQSA